MKKQNFRIPTLNKEEKQKLVFNYKLRNYLNIKLLMYYLQN